jgi:hypothetical protein
MAVCVPCDFPIRHPSPLRSASYPARNRSSRPAHPFTREAAHDSRLSAIGSCMPLPWKPEDHPAAVCFHWAENDGAFQVTVTPVPPDSHVTPGGQSPYRIDGGEPRFASRDAFKAKVVEVGMSPAVAEDGNRSFNATARQLRELGFHVELLNTDSSN